MGKKILYALISICVLVVITVAPVWSGSDSTPEKSHKWLREVSLLTGYGNASLENKSADYEVIPILPQFGFDINPIAKKLHIEPKGIFLA